MAQTFAKLRKIPGAPDVWGGHGVFVAQYQGNASYVNSGTFGTSGEIIDSIGALTLLGSANTNLRNILAIPNIQTVSGTYTIRFFPNAAGSSTVVPSGPPKRWFAHWYSQAGTEVSNATNLSAEFAIIMIIGG